ncbi:hypothetical protein GGI42DRAFT_207888 [Trichoderma sp. SZMC 28013]
MADQKKTPHSLLASMHSFILSAALRYYIVWREVHRPRLASANPNAEESISCVLSSLLQPVKASLPVVVSVCVCRLISSKSRASLFVRCTSLAIVKGVSCFLTQKGHWLLCNHFHSHSLNLSMRHNLHIFSCQRSQVRCRTVKTLLHAALVKCSRHHQAFQ